MGRTALLIFLLSIYGIASLEAFPTTLEKQIARLVLGPELYAEQYGNSHQRRSAGPPPGVPSRPVAVQGSSSGTAAAAPPGAPAGAPPGPPPGAPAGMPPGPPPSAPGGMPPGPPPGAPAGMPPGPPPAGVAPGSPSAAPINGTVAPTLKP